MPKKTNRRPAKARPRSRPPAPRAAGSTAVAEDELSVEVAPAAPSPVVPPGPTVAARQQPAMSRRAPPAARKTPALTINYDYLRRDLRTLLVLATTMVVLVVAAYFVFH